MEHQRDLAAATAQGAPADGAVAGGLGHPQLLLFDAVRDLLTVTGLPPLPQVYELLWRHVAREDVQLSAAVEAALAAAGLDMAAVTAIAAAHGGGPAAMAEIVECARVQTDRLSQSLRDGQDNLATYGRAIADGDAALNGPTAPATPSELAALIQPLGAATSVMMAANRRLEAELAEMVAEAVALRDRLNAAERAAVTDALTGVLNRRGLIEAVEAAQARAGAEGALSVALVDIDFFKRVNDRWGHALGDEVLRFVARHLADGVGPDGTVGRLGGEEFVALLPATPIKDATATLDRLRGALAAQIIRRTADGVSMGRITFSAGLAASHVSDTPDSVIARADGALYNAKRMGRDRVIPDMS